MARCLDCERANGPGAACTCITEAVVDALRERDLDVSLEYPDVIHIQTEQGVFVAGTANGPWGVDGYPPEEAETLEQPDASIVTTVAGDCDDAEQIARAVFAAIATVVAARRSVRS